jgi:RNA polymerase sigma factor (sigma-70 family)
MSERPPQGLAAEDMVQTALRLQGGDVSALETLIRVLGPRVAAGLQKRHSALSAEDIEDVLSAASHRVWQSRRQYDPTRGSLGAWFFIIADNLARDLLRRQARQPRPCALAARLAAIEVVDPAEPLDEPSCRKQMLDEILQTLPALDRWIITGFAEAGGEGPWAAELARDLGMRAGTIRVRCRRIKARLRKQLEAIPAAVGLA